MYHLIRGAALALAAMALTVLAIPAAQADNYPSRPVHLYVAFPPGGAADIVARLVADPLARQLGQPVVVENKPGSGGNIVGDLIAHAAPDGYSLLIGPDNLFTINPHIFKKMSFDPNKDLVPVASVVQNQLFLVANTKLPVKTFQDFIALAKSTKPPMFYASIGNGSLHHLAMEMLKQDAGIDLIHVPYKGGGPAALGVIGGQASAMFGGGSVFNLIQSGQLHGLAVSTPKRSKLLPDLPSISEFYPDYDATIWQGVFAPAGTPQAIIERVRKEVNAIVQTKDFADKLEKVGAGEPFLTTPEEFRARIQKDFEKYGRITKAAGVQVR